MGVYSGIKARLGITAKPSPSSMIGQRSKSTNTNDIRDMFNINYNKEQLKYTDYERMLTDPQIKSGFELIRMFLLSRSIQFVPGSDDESDIEIAHELEDMFDNMSYPMRKVRNDMYSALIYGYSVSEVIWKASEDGNRVDIDRIRPIPISTLQDCFRYDDIGDLEEIIQTVDSEEIPIEPSKCLVYTYDECFGNRSGKSILDACYDNWFQKQKILKWWNVFLQKHEGPTLVGKVENPQFKEVFREQLDDIQDGRTNMTIGMNDTVEVLESTHRGEGFKDAIGYHDTMIYRKMNIGTMILGQEDGAGAYAQSKTQMDSLNIFLDGIHADISAELQIKIKELVDMNYTVEKYPKIQFETFEEENLLALLGGLKPLIDSSAINPQDQWFRQLIAETVGKYSDADLTELLEEPEEMEQTFPGEVQPTPAEQEEPAPMEQQKILEETINQIPAKNDEEV